MAHIFISLQTSCWKRKQSPGPPGIVCPINRPVTVQFRDVRGTAGNREKGKLPIKTQRILFHRHLDIYAYTIMKQRVVRLDIWEVALCVLFQATFSNFREMMWLSGEPPSLPWCALILNLPLGPSSLRTVFRLFHAGLAMLLSYFVGEVQFVSQLMPWKAPCLSENQSNGPFLIKIIPIRLVYTCQIYQIIWRVRVGTVKFLAPWLKACILVLAIDRFGDKEYVHCILPITYRYALNVLKYSSHRALGEWQEIDAVICYRLKIFANHDYKFNTSCRTQSLFVLKAKRVLGHWCSQVIVFHITTAGSNLVLQSVDIVLLFCYSPVRLNCL